MNHCINSFVTGLYEDLGLLPSNLHLASIYLKTIRYNLKNIYNLKLISDTGKKKILFIMITVENSVQFYVRFRVVSFRTK